MTFPTTSPTIQRSADCPRKSWPISSFPFFPFWISVSTSAPTTLWQLRRAWLNNSPSSRPSPWMTFCPILLPMHNASSFSQTLLLSSSSNHRLSKTLLRPLHLTLAQCALPPSRLVTPAMPLFPETRRCHPSPMLQNSKFPERQTAKKCNHPMPNLYLTRQPLQFQLSAQHLLLWFARLASNSLADLSVTVQLILFSAWKLERLQHFRWQVHSTLDVDTSVFMSAACYISTITINEHKLFLLSNLSCLLSQLVPDYYNIQSIYHHIFYHISPPPFTVNTCPTYIVSCIVSAYGQTYCI